MKQNKKIIYLLILLMIFSFINNYSAKFILSIYHNYLIKQFLWYVCGFLIIYIVSKINLNFIFKNSFVFYILINILLIFTLFFGVTVNGSTSWLRFGFFNIQPSEFAKVILVIYLYYFSIKNKNISNIKYIIVTFFIILIPSLITFFEPDIGGVMFYFIIYVGFIMTRKIDKRWYLFVLSLVLVFGFSFLRMYFFNQEKFIKIFGTSFFYRMDRITDFLDGDGFQINRAIVSTGGAGLFGRKLGNILEYFPEAPTDFAFVLLISNIGFIGIFIFLVFYSYFILLIIKKIKYNKILITPIALMLIMQFGINIFMNIGFFPVIGITLPFISYGGSNLISYMILIALVLNEKSINKKKCDLHFI